MRRQETGALGSHACAIYAQFSRRLQTSKLFSLVQSSVKMPEKVEWGINAASSAKG